MLRINFRFHRDSPPRLDAFRIASSLSYWRPAARYIFMLNKIICLSIKAFLKFGVCGHVTLWRHGIGSTNALLLLLHILLIGHLLLLLGSDVVLCHPTAAPTWHICLWGGNLLMVHVFGGFGAFVGIDAVLIACGWLGSVEAGLESEGQLGKVA